MESQSKHYPLIYYNTEDIHSKFHTEIPLVDEIKCLSNENIVSCVRTLITVSYSFPLKKPTKRPTEGRAVDDFFCECNKI